MTGGRAPGRDYGADSSPDGRLLVLASQRSGEGNAQLYLMNPDGSYVRRLTFSSGEGRRVLDDYAHWSPDGTQILFDSERDGNHEVYVMNADGSDQRRLTTSPERDSDPYWAPIR